MSSSAEGALVATLEVLENEKLPAGTQIHGTIIIASDIHDVLIVVGDKSPELTAKDHINLVAEMIASQEEGSKISTALIDISIPLNRPALCPTDTCFQTRIIGQALEQQNQAPLIADMLKRFLATVMRVFPRKS